MTARRCEVTDIPWMLNLGQQMHEESRYYANNLKLSKVATFLRQLIQSPSGIVLRTEGGFIFGAVSPYWFGDDLFALDYVLYVLPEQRKSGQAGELIDGYVEAAKELGVAPKDIMLEHSTGTESALLDKLYQSRGFRPVGTYHVLAEE